MAPITDKRRQIPHNERKRKNPDADSATSRPARPAPFEQSTNRPRRQADHSNIPAVSAHKHAKPSPSTQSSGRDPRALRRSAAPTPNPGPSTGGDREVIDSIGEEDNHSDKAAKVKPESPTPDNDHLAAAQESPEQQPDTSTNDTINSLHRQLRASRLRR